MNNDIEPWLGFDGQGVNLSKIGKYDKFVEFEFSKHNPKDDHFNIIRFKTPPFMFHTDQLTCEEYSKKMGSKAIASLYHNTKKAIEKEIERKLGDKIQEINRKAKERIEKLKKKPREKLEKEMHFDILKKAYFKPEIEEGSEVSS